MRTFQSALSLSYAQVPGLLESRERFIDTPYSNLICVYVEVGHRALNELKVSSQCIALH